MSAKPGCQAREIELPRLSSRGTLMILYYLVLPSNPKDYFMKFPTPYLALLMLIVQYPLAGQVCLPEGIHFTRQSQIDSFSIQYPGCTEIGGDVCIGNCIDAVGSDITNLDGLMPLNSIKGKLSISHNPLLTSIEGLKNLVVIEDDLLFSWNDVLSSFKGLDQIRVMKGSFTLEWSTGIDSLAGFDMLDTIAGTLTMTYLWDLTSITAFPNLKYLGGYRLFGLNQLKSIPDMNNLLYLGDFSLRFNGLTDLPEFPLLSAINGDFHLNGNFALPALRGYENINRVTGDLIIEAAGEDIIRETETFNLNAFHHLTFVGGNFRIHVERLDTLDGFTALDSVGGIFSVSGGIGLHTFPQDNQFKYIGGNIYLDNLPLLEDLDCINGLENIIGGLGLSGCRSLVSLSAISHFTEYGGGFELSQIDLANLSELSNLKKIGGNLRISDCNSLANLQGLEGLDSINGHIYIHRNLNLESLEGIQHIDPQTIHASGYFAVNITENSRLSVCNVASICEALRVLRRSYRIENNALGCDHISQIECKDFGLSGIVFFDSNQNKVQDTDEVGIPGIPVRFQPDDLLSITNGQGEFFMFADSSDLLTMTSEHSVEWLLTTDSLSYTSAFEEGSAGNDDHLFGLYPVADWYDLSLGLTSNPIRCNQNTHFFLHWLNGSTRSVDGRIIVQYDSLATFVSATLPPSMHDIAARELTWDIESLSLYTDQFVRITFKMANETYVGQMMNFSTSSFIDTSGTEVLMDHVDYTPVLVCAVDPNDKLVMPPGVREENYTLKDDQLTYTIRFENLGNAEAIDITIVDTLDASLDINSFQVINSSFPVLTTIDGQVITFFFKNIWLVAQGTGFVTYAIKAQSDVPDLTPVENLAGIVFDFNQPIVTNTTTNTLVFEICDDVSAVIDTVICHGENFLGYTESGIYFDTLQIGSICDSFATIRLTVIDPEMIQLDTAVCEGESFHGFDSTGVFTYDSINPVTGCTDLVSLNLEVIPLGMGQCITGTREIDAMMIRIYPNPAQEEIYITSSADISSVRLYTIDGLEVPVEKISFANPQSILQISSSTPDGFYLMAIEVDGRVYFEKVVIDR
jgi:uncharacterized repeat protein (TIGR01451 family)